MINFDLIANRFMRLCISTSFKVSREYQRDPAKRLTTDLLQDVFNNLKLADLSACCLTSKAWRHALVESSAKTLWKDVIYRTVVFGPEKWFEYLGDVGKVPALPSNIVEILKNPCPYFPGKKVIQTHKLVLIPGSINGKPFTLKSLNHLFPASKTDGGVKLRDDCRGNIINRYGDNSEETHWVLMLKDVIRCTQKYFVRDTKLGYQIPRIMQAIACCISMEFVDSGWFSDKTIFSQDFYDIEKNLRVEIHRYIGYDEVDFSEPSYDSYGELFGEPLIERPIRYTLSTYVGPYAAPFIPEYFRLGVVLRDLNTKS